MSNYLGGFSSWKDVTEAFAIDLPEPDEVLAAEYDQPDYEGYATVVYRQGDAYFVATGSHCSCYGLEGQWDPERYDADTLLKVLDRQDRYGAQEATKQAAAIMRTRFAS